MKKISLGVTITCMLYLSACSNSEKKAISIDASKVMIKPFSDTLKADTFKIKLLGKNPEDMYMRFTITSFNGQGIYNKDIKATDLFKNYDATIDLNKKKNQVKFIMNELDNFFDEENFLEPAITDQETPDQYVPDKAFYEELKNSQLNGFIYRLGKENKIYIGWSENNRKVKTYYSCCK